MNKPFEPLTRCRALPGPSTAESSVATAITRRRTEAEKYRFSATPTSRTAVHVARVFELERNSGGRRCGSGPAASRTFRSRRLLVYEITDRSVIVVHRERRDQGLPNAACIAAPAEAGGSSGGRKIFAAVPRLHLVARSALTDCRDAGLPAYLRDAFRCRS